MIKLQVKNKKLGPVRGRHPWLFSQGILNLPDKIESGEPVVLISEAGDFLAQGYFNSYSQIAVRIWSYDQKEKIDQDFFTRRITASWNLRKKYIDEKLTNAYRLVNGENDMLPGLIIDKYDDYFVVQCHNRGIEKWKDLITKSLIAVFDPKGIYERSDAFARRVENLSKQSGLLYGTMPDLVKIYENGFSFLIDIKEGQKTGFFLDQRDKRLALMKYAKDKTVANCFSYSGGFSVYALAAGARSVTSVDVSQKAIDLAKENIKINKLKMDKVEFIVEDVKLYLKEAKPCFFDLIILDPPAFIKDRRKIKEGIEGYKKINEEAIKKINQDGILLSCSCSAHLNSSDFRYMLSESAGRTQRNLRILEKMYNSIDHPELVAFSETGYLKSYFCHVD